MSDSQIHIKKFEELSAGELYDVLRCRAEVFAVEQNIAYQDLDGLDQNSLHIFLKDGDAIVSYARVIRPQHGCAMIGRVLTMRPYRRQGHARRVMLCAIEQAGRMSPVIEIHAQAYLKGFYESLGFMAIGDEYILEGLPHLTMKIEKLRAH